MTLERLRLELATLRHSFEVEKLAVAINRGYDTAELAKLGHRIAQVRRQLAAAEPERR
jgi:hypothetical protein